MKLGITGHQDLGFSQTWVREAIKNIILGLKATHGFTSLARGADQIFAEVLSELKVTYTAIIPCAQYKATFSDDKHLINYTKLMDSAKTVEVLNYEKPEGVAFYEAGKKVVDMSDKLIAVWDGKKARHLGGTGDADEFALAVKKPIIHLNPISKSIQII